MTRLTNKSQVLPTNAVTISQQTEVDVLQATPPKTDDTYAADIVQLCNEADDKAISDTHEDLVGSDDTYAADIVQPCNEADDKAISDACEDLVGTDDTYAADIVQLCNEAGDKAILDTHEDLVETADTYAADIARLRAEVEEEAVLDAYEELVEICQSLPKTNASEDLNRIERAFLVAYRSHKGQTRKTGEPYILHPIAVARIVAEEMKLDDSVSIASALLHDVVEDTQTSLGDIEKEFGAVLAKIVDGLTKIKRVSKKQTENAEKNAQELAKKQEREAEKEAHLRRKFQKQTGQLDKLTDYTEQTAPPTDNTQKLDHASQFQEIQQKKGLFIDKARNLKKVLLTLAEDVRIIIIKIADRLHNMRTMDSMQPRKQLEIASETIYIYTPIAHRLGLYRIKSELEDLCMKYTAPDEYKEIARKLAATKTQREAQIRGFIEPLRQRLIEEGLPTFRIFGRAKHIYSIHNKIKTKNVPFEGIFDLFAIRIVIDVPPGKNEREYCFRAYALITSWFRATGDRMRDWISNPRTNGYQSLHVTVLDNDNRPIEIQIRTEAMDAIAERGVAAHYLYKGSNTKSKAEKNKDTEAKFDDFIKQISDILQSNETNILEALSEIRNSIYDNEIYVYTPNGETRVLRAGSTVLDFAFDIHTDLGCSCIGGEIDGKLYRISHKLENGQQVKIITSKKQKPSPEWLNFTATTKARAKIKSVLNNIALAAATEGEETLLRKLDHWKKPTSANFIQLLAARFRYPSQRAFLVAIANGTFDLQQIKALNVEGEKIIDTPRNIAKPKREPEPEQKSTDNPISPPNPNLSNADAIQLSGDLDTMSYRLATCCKPVAGDQVFGFVTINNGITIHRNNCPNAEQMYARYPYRIVDLDWNKSDNNDKSFVVNIQLSGIDDKGLVNKITDIISKELSINMLSISLSAKEGIFKGKLKAEVKNATEADRLIKRLQKVEAIHTVTRLGR